MVQHPRLRRPPTQRGSLQADDVLRRGQRLDETGAEYAPGLISRPWHGPAATAGCDVGGGGDQGHVHGRLGHGVQHLPAGASSEHRDDQVSQVVDVHHRPDDRLPRRDEPADAVLDGPTNQLSGYAAPRPVHHPGTDDDTAATDGGRHLLLDPLAATDQADRPQRGELIQHRPGSTHHRAGAEYPASTEVDEGPPPPTQTGQQRSHRGGVHVPAPDRGAGVHHGIHIGDQLRPDRLRPAEIGDPHHRPGQRPRCAEQRHDLMISNQEVLHHPRADVPGRSDHHDPHLPSPTDHDHHSRRRMSRPISV